MNGTRYAVVIEKGETSYGAYVPDLAGCVAVGQTEAEVETLIAEAIALHLEHLREHGKSVPEPNSQVEYIDPAAVAYTVIPASFCTVSKVSESAALLSGR